MGWGLGDLMINDANEGLRLGTQSSTSISMGSW